MCSNSRITACFILSRSLEEKTFISNYLIFGCELFASVSQALLVSLQLVLQKDEKSEIRICPL